MIKTKNKTFFIIAGFILLSLVIFFYFKNNIVTPYVLTTNPSNESEEITEDSQIDINFNGDIKESNKGSVSVNIQPQIEYDSTWISNTYKVIPKSSLQNNTTYTINVLYKKSNIYSFSFKTSIFSKEKIKTDGKQATEDDLIYGEALKKLVNDYPFYTSLPIKTKDYVIYYDFDEEKFAITFLNEISSEELKNSLTNEAVLKIKNIGGSEPIRYYTVQP